MGHYRCVCSFACCFLLLLALHCIGDMEYYIFAMGCGHLMCWGLHLYLTGTLL